MSEQWTPTTENYLGRVTKGRIQAAVREARGEATASLIDHLKRPDMAREAERLLKGTGWLPQPLRTRGLTRSAAPVADVPAPAGGSVEAAEGGEALPAFLANDESEELIHDEEGIEPLPDHFLDGPLPTDIDAFDPDYAAVAAE